MASKPRLLVVSAVLPFPRRAGQNQRVYYKLVAAREFFRTVFLTVADPGRLKDVREQLLTLCDEAIVLPSRYSRSRVTKAWHKTVGTLHSLRTGLKFSNYLVGKLEFPLSRLNGALAGERFDCAVYEYWHAVDSLPVLQEKNVPCVLDMHNVLWQSYSRQLDARPGLPAAWKRRAIEKYQAAEEDAWQTFDALIAINQAEGDYVRQVVGPGKRVFFAPMGTDLGRWPYSWQPETPPRIVYYGGLSSPHNQEDALRCYERVMPHIWREHPQAQLWVVGSNPPRSLQELPDKDRRVVVTGFVDAVSDVLKTMTAVLLPWSGTYGFRSRLIEVMALGVPVVTTPQAVYGMELEVGQGLFLEETDHRMAMACNELIQKPQFALEQSRLARAQVERKLGFDATYGRLATELLEFVMRRET